MNKCPSIRQIPLCFPEPFQYNFPTYLSNCFITSNLNVGCFCYLFYLISRRGELLSDIQLLLKLHILTQFKLYCSGDSHKTLFWDGVIGKFTLEVSCFHFSLKMIEILN